MVISGYLSRASPYQLILALADPRLGRRLKRAYAKTVCTLRENPEPNRSQLKLPAAR